jgi:hypothetical protein
METEAHRFSQDWLQLREAPIVVFSLSVRRIESYGRSYLHDSAQGWHGTILKM